MAVQIREDLPNARKERAVNPSVKQSTTNNDFYNRMVEKASNLKSNSVNTGTNRKNQGSQLQTTKTTTTPQPVRNESSIARDRIEVGIKDDAERFDLVKPKDYTGKSKRSDFGSDREYERFLYDTGNAFNDKNAIEYLNKKATENNTSAKEYYESVAEGFSKRQQTQESQDKYKNEMENDEDTSKVIAVSNAQGKTKTVYEMNQWGKEISTNMKNVVDEYDGIIKALEAGKMFYNDDVRRKLENLQKEYEHWRGESEDYSSYGGGSLVDFSEQIQKDKEALAKLGESSGERTTEESLEYMTEAKRLYDEIAELERLQDYKEHYELSANYDWLKEHGTKEEIENFEDIYSNLDNSFIENFGLKISSDATGLMGSVATMVGQIPGITTNLFEGLKTKTAEVLNNGGLITDDYLEEVKTASSKAVEKYSSNAATDWGMAMLDMADHIAYKQRIGASDTEIFWQDVISNAIKNAATMWAGMGVASAIGINARVGMEVGTALMSSESFARTLQQDMNQGYSYQDSLSHATFMFAVEFATEQIGGERFLSRFENTNLTSLMFGDVFYNFAANGILSGAAESIEEFMGWAVEPFVKQLTLGEIPTAESWSEDELVTALESAFMSGVFMDSVAGVRDVYSTFFSVNSEGGMLKVEAIVDKAKQMLNQANDTKIMANGLTEKQLLQELIRQGENAIYNYSQKSVLGNMVQNVSQTERVRSSLAHDIRQGAFRVFQAENNAQIQQETDVLKLGEQATSIVQDYLYQQDINADAAQFYSKTKQQRNEIVRINNYAKSIGANVRFKNECFDQDGNLVDGSYNFDTNQIEISMTAKLGEVSTLIHEYSHFAENSEYYHIFQDQLKEWMGEDAFNDQVSRLLMFNQLQKVGATFKTATQSQLDDAFEYAKNIDENTLDKAQREITAMNVQQLLGNEEFASRLAKYNTSFAFRLMTDIQNIANLGGNVGKIEATMMKAVRDAQLQRETQNLETEYSYRGISEKPKEAKAGKEPVKTIGPVSINDDGSADISYSHATWNEINQPELVKDLVKNLGVSKEKAQKWVNDVNKIDKMIADDRMRYDYEANPIYRGLRTNDEYMYTVDFSTLCKKRIALSDTIDAIQKVLDARQSLDNAILTGDDYIEIRKMLADKQQEVSCGFCYVESRRKDLDRVAKQFIDQYNDPTLAIGDLTTVAGVEKLQRERPEVYEDFASFNRRRGSGKVNLVESRTEYRGEIMDISEKEIEELIRIGGMRLQSYSDFETPHLIDMMQVVIDMARRGLTSQAFTKVPNFADAFGKTGVKINLSLVCKGVDENGQLIFDDIEGMNHEEAFRLREKYSNNVGTILVGKDDETIKAAMADPRIDFIIPYHRSGWGKKEYEALGIKGYKDYTPWQKEYWVVPRQRTNKNGKVITERAPASNFYPIDYWDYSKTGKENAETYLRLCAEDGRIPKFSNFLVDNGDGSWSLQPDGSTDGYWKTLIDFKMYNNDGVGVPQQKVMPIFDNEVNQRIMNEYQGDHRKNHANQDVVNEFLTTKGIDNVSYSQGVRVSDLNSDGEKLTKAQQKYFADSKVRDDDGNLIVMHHGTDSYGFTVFDPRFSDDKRSLFFTDSKEMAKTYYRGTGAIKSSRAGLPQGGIYDVYLNLKNPMIIDAKGSYWAYIQKDDAKQYVAERKNLGDFVFLKQEDYDKFNNKYNLEELNRLYEQAKENGTVEYNGEELDEYEMKDELSWAEERAIPDYLKYLEDNGKQITAREFFDNWQDYNWFDLYSLTNEYNSGNGPSFSEIKDDETFYSSYEEAVQAYKEMLEQDIESGDMDEDFWDEFTFDVTPKTGETVEERIIRNTRYWSREAKEQGYDGVIIKNVEDYGGGGGIYHGKPHTVAIAFNSNQVKSIDNENPTGNDDIRYSSGLSPDDLNVGYHYGNETLDNSKKSETLGDRGGRSTGAFGTGTYFFGSKQEPSNFYNNGKKTIHSVDFSKYNLFKVQDQKSGSKLHEFFKALDDTYNYRGEIRTQNEVENKLKELADQVYKANYNVDVKEVFNDIKNTLDENTALRILQRAISKGEKSGTYSWNGMVDEDGVWSSAEERLVPLEEVLEKVDSEDFASAIDYIANNQYLGSVADYLYTKTAKLESIENDLDQIADILGVDPVELETVVDTAIDHAREDAEYERWDTDSVGTRIMKDLGYEGIDVRGIEGLDNSSYGSVIYDLKPDTIIESKNTGDVLKEDEKEPRYAVQDDLSNVDVDSEFMTVPNKDTKLHKVVQEGDFNKKSSKFQNDMGGIDQRKVREDVDKKVENYKKKKTAKARAFREMFEMDNESFERFARKVEEWRYETDDKERRKIKAEIVRMFPESPTISPTGKKQRKYKIGDSAFNRYLTLTSDKKDPRRGFKSRTAFTESMDAEEFVRKFLQLAESEDMTYVEMANDLIESGMAFDVRGNMAMKLGALVDELNKIKTDDSIEARDKIQDALITLGSYTGQTLQSLKNLYDLTSPKQRELYYHAVRTGLINEMEKRYGDKYTKVIGDIFDENHDDLLNGDKSEKGKRQFERGLQQMIAGLRSALPKTFASKLIQFRYWSMLSSLKTALVNAVANKTSLLTYQLKDANTQLVENILVKKGLMTDKERTVKLNNDTAKTKANKKIAEQMFKENFSDNSSKYLDAEFDPSEKYIRRIEEVEGRTNKFVKKGTEVTRLLQKVQRQMLDDTKAMKDRFIINIDNLAQARGIDLSEVTPYSQTYYDLYDEAIEQALEVVHHDQTTLNYLNDALRAMGYSEIRIDSKYDGTLVGETVKAVKKWKQRNPQAGEIAGFIDRALLPFMRTNASIAKKAIQFNPTIAVFNSISKYKKMVKGTGTAKEFVDVATKGMTGLEIYGLAFALAAAGLVKWERDDKDYSGEISVKIGDNKYLTIDPLDPVSTMFGMGAMVYQDIKEEGGPTTKAAEQIFTDTLDIAQNQQLQMFSTIFQLAREVQQARKGENQYGNEYGWGDFGWDLAYTFASQHIPAILRDSGRLLDPNRKATYSEEGYRYFANRIANNLPVIRTMFLENSLDALGNAKTYIEPFTGNKYVDNVISNMISRLHLVDENGNIINDNNTVRDASNKTEEAKNETLSQYQSLAEKYQYQDNDGNGYSDTHWLRTSVPSKFYTGDGEHELSATEKTEYGKAWSDQWTSAAKSLEKNKTYKGLSEENKVDVLYSAQSMATKVQSAEYAVENDLPMTKGQADAYKLKGFYTTNGKIDGEKLGLIALATAKDNNNYKLLREVDENGKTVKNSSAMKTRQMYEEAGIYNEIVEYCQKNKIDYSAVGLNKTVVGMKSSTGKTTTLSSYIKKNGYSKKSSKSKTKTYKASVSKSSSSSRKKIKTSTVNVAGGSGFFDTLLRNMKKRT